MKKALIAMSGGVDSSVAAKLMLDAGYDCMGATMKLFDSDDILMAQREKTCCSLSDVEDARSVARRLGMPYQVFNFKGDFKEKVIDKFIATYEAGGTPNPCIDCNRYLKFDHLLNRARELGCDYIATGHYVQRWQDENGRWGLRKTDDPGKDQSYVLYSLTQDQLAHTLFPLGGMHKDAVRAIAEEQGLCNARKHDSQDICFIQTGTYADFIEARLGRKFKPGNFVDEAGNVLGRHKGIIHYTVGQRKGLGLALPQPMYVKEIDTKNNAVILTTNEGLFTKNVTAKNINLIDCDAITEPRRVKARIRYHQQEQWATVTQPDADTLQLVFDEPQRAITKGQSVVMYDGDVVVGGGTIV